MKKKCYISGKITGLNENEYISNFRNGCEAIVVLDYTPVNPLDNAKDGLSYAELMRKDIAVLVECDAICMLPDYRESRGARLELEIAKVIGLKIYYL